MVISGAGLFCLTLALVEGDTWGWTSATIIALFVAAVVSFPLFMWWETHTSSPMFPVTLLRIRSFTAANTAVMFIGLAMGGTFLMLVLFLVSVLGYSELRAATAMTIMPVLALIVAPNAGRLNDRIGPRFPAAAGAACFAIGLALLAQLGRRHPALGRDVAGGLHRRRHGPRDADPLGRLDGLAAAAGARRRLGVAQHDAPGRASRSASPCSSPSSRTPWRRTRSRRPGQAAGLIATQPQLSPAEKGAYTATLIENAKAAAGSGGGAAKMTTVPAAGRAAAAGRLAGRVQASSTPLVAELYRDDIAESFTWPFYAAALAALIAIIPALITGRRLGEHEGHDEMTRSERLEASGRAEADEAGAPLMDE